MGFERGWILIVYRLLQPSSGKLIVNTNFYKFRVKLNQIQVHEIDFFTYILSLIKLNFTLDFQYLFIISYFVKIN